jgi:hypothetical protein
MYQVLVKDLGQHVWFVVIIVNLQTQLALFLWMGGLAIITL